jgi:hypothetical protein
LDDHFAYQALSLDARLCARSYFMKTLASKWQIAKDAQLTPDVDVGRFHCVQTALTIAVCFPTTTLVKRFKALLSAGARTGLETTKGLTTHEIAK